LKGRLGRLPALPLARFSSTCPCRTRFT
jgi:hypothetical protein